MGVAESQAAPDSSTCIYEDKCLAYNVTDGCGWTHEYNCPGQTTATKIGDVTANNSVHGSPQVATPNPSTGFQCCCTNRGWEATCGVAASTQTTCTPKLPAVYADTTLPTPVLQNAVAIPVASTANFEVGQQIIIDL